jgi:hypothetical protein
MDMVINIYLIGHGGKLEASSNDHEHQQHFPYSICNQ